MVEIVWRLSSDIKFCQTSFWLEASNLYQQQYCSLVNWFANFCFVLFFISSFLVWLLVCWLPNVQQIMKISNQKYFLKLYQQSKVSFIATTTLSKRQKDTASRYWKSWMNPNRSNLSKCCFYIYFYLNLDFRRRKNYENFSPVLLVFASLSLFTLTPPSPPCSTGELYDSE